MSNEEQETPIDISLCNYCYCMTKPIDGKCGKCGASAELVEVPTQEQS